MTQRRRLGARLCSVASRESREDNARTDSVILSAAKDLGIAEEALFPCATDLPLAGRILRSARQRRARATKCSRTAGEGAAGIRWRGLHRFEEAACVAITCHVERPRRGAPLRVGAQSRHPAANTACGSFAARFLHSGLWPPVGMTEAKGKPKSATECRPHP
jgi:hypothetical protein